MCLALLSFSDKKVCSIVGDLEVIEALVEKLTIEVLFSCCHIFLAEH
jgi:hypothetical protein